MILVEALAWPLVALILIGAVTHAFHAWRHPSLEAVRLDALEADLALAKQKIGNLELGSGLRSRRG